LIKTTSVNTHELSNIYGVVGGDCKLIQWKDPLVHNISKLLVSEKGNELE